MNKPIYGPGAIYRNEEGYVFQRQKGNWVLIQLPDGSPPPTPKEE